MRKVKNRRIILGALVALFVFMFGLACAALAPKSLSARADSYLPSAVFSAGTGGEVGASGDEESRVQFTLNDGGSVYFRRDLAIKWFEAAAEGDETGALGDALNVPGVEKYFSMTFAFPELNFSEFRISFESAEENITKNALATNALVFTKDANGLYVAVENAEYDKDDEKAVPPVKQKLDYTAGQTLTLSFAAPTGENRDAVGEFALSLSVDGGQPVALDDFTNIGGNYFEYRSSAATTPSTPMTFTASVASGTQKVTMYSLNGQTFTLNGDGRVEDNAAPVLSLNEQVYAFRLGQRFSLSYEAIDVCDDSVSVSRSYYMAKKNEEGQWLKPKTDSTDYSTLTTSTFFMPTSEDDEELAYVSIRFKLDDGREGDDYFVYLTWYAANPDVVATLGEGDEVYDYIKVDLEAKNPAYTVLGADPDKNLPEESKVNRKSASYDAICNDYQTALTAAADKVSAGDGAYLYLPSLRGLISSESADYRNLRFSIYYYKPSQGATASATSSSSLRYNNLRIEVDQIGEYRMRVIAADASGNEMRYYNQDRELVTVSSSNVWDIEGIPEFRFNIGYSGPVIEDADEQTLGYRDNTYSISPFDIIALDGYETEYSLYRINEGELPEGESLPAYATLVSEAEEWVEKFETWDALKPEGEPKILVEIGKYNSEITEDDDEWSRTNNDYAWDPDASLSFCPQERGMYIVKVVVIDSYLPNTTAEAYQVIEVRNPIDTIPGQSRWLQNNVAAVVLFSISGVLLIAIVILFVVKPSDKKIEEVDLEKLKGKAKPRK